MPLRNAGDEIDEAGALSQVQGNNLDQNSIELEKTRIQIQSYHESLKEAESRIAELNNTLNATHSEKNTWQWRAEALESDVKHLTNLLEQSQTQQNNIHSEKNRWQWRTEALEGDIKHLTGLITNAQAEQDKLTSEKNKWQWQAEALQRHIDSMSELRSQNRLVEFDYPYTPISRNWANISGGNVYERMLAAGKDRYQSWISDFSDFGKNFEKISIEQTPDETQPFWDNGWFAPLDAIAHYGLLAKVNPKLYIEVGSGNSTKFARRAIADHGLRTKIISIDPFPRAVIDELCDEVIRVGLQDCDLSIFSQLDPDDVVFIDNSHRSFPNSDVTVFFTEILPALNSSTIWGVHDIFLPRDYPEEWLGRFYNEQYLLMTYLLGGAAGDKIELPNAYIAKSPELLAPITNALGASPPWGKTPLVGGSFWMRKS